MTRLESYIRHHGIRPTELERRSGVSRQQILKLRKGLETARLRTAVALANGVSELREGKRVYVVELFKMSRSDEAFYAELMRSRAELARIRREERAASSRR